MCESYENGIDQDELAGRLSMAGGQAGSNSQSRSVAAYLSTKIQIKPGGFPRLIRPQANESDEPLCSEAELTQRTQGSRSPMGKCNWGTTRVGKGSLGTGFGGSR